MDWDSDADSVPAAARKRELSGPLRGRPGLWGHGPGRLLLTSAMSMCINILLSNRVFHVANVIFLKLIEPFLWFVSLKH